MNNNQYRKFLIKIIIQNYHFLYHSQRFFSRVFFQQLTKINNNFHNQEKKYKNPYLIFNEKYNDEEIMNFLDESVQYEKKINSNYVIYLSNKCKNISI